MRITRFQSQGSFRGTHLKGFPIWNHPSPVSGLRASPFRDEVGRSQPMPYLSD